MFSPNDRVVHPMHGAGVIEEITEQRVNGENRRYYVLRIPAASVKLMVPVEGSVNTGLRAVVSPETAREIIESFAAIEVHDAPNWNKRYRENMDRLKSGRIGETAGVYKSLLVRSRDKGLSTGEHKMFNTVRQVLLSELSAVLGLGCDEIEKMLSGKL